MRLRVSLFNKIHTCKISIYGSKYRLEKDDYTTHISESIRNCRSETMSEKKTK
jgi:hypothetical protein